MLKLNTDEKSEEFCYDGEKGNQLFPGKNKGL